MFSSLPPSNQAKTPGTKPLVHIVPSPQESIQQQNNAAIDTTTPKVVSVQSLQTGKLRIVPSPSTRQNKVTVQNLVLSSGHKIHLQTPVSQNVTSVPNSSAQYQVKTVSFQPSHPLPQVRTAASAMLPTTPMRQNQLPQQISTPLSSPAMPTSYKPLESLKEVNRQATQAAVVSPVSAVIPEASDSTKKSPTEIRNKVTVSDRYRYIVPSPQTSVSAVPAAAAPQLVQTSVSAVPTAAASQLVQTSVSAVPAAAAPQLVQSVPVTVQPIAPAAPQALQV